MLLMGLLILAGVLLLIMIGMGTFWVLVQTGVIVQKAMEPPTNDTGNYSIDQGRDSGRNE